MLGHPFILQEKETVFGLFDIFLNLKLDTIIAQVRLRQEIAIMILFGYQLYELQREPIRWAVKRFW